MTTEARDHRSPAEWIDKLAVTRSVWRIRCLTDIRRLIHLTGFCGDNRRAIDFGRDYVTGGLGRKWLLREGFGYNGNRAVPKSERSRAARPTPE